VDGLEVGVHIGDLHAVMGQKDQQIVGDKFAVNDLAGVGFLGHLDELQGGLHLDLPEVEDGVLNGNHQDDVGLVGSGEPALPELQHPDGVLDVFHDDLFGEFLIGKCVNCK
jgi:hypothetical protein